MTLAWQVMRVYAKSMKDRRVPILKSLMLPETAGNGHRPRHQSVDQLRLALDVLSARTGIPLRDRSVARGQ